MNSTYRHKAVVEAHLIIAVSGVRRNGLHQANVDITLDNGHIVPVEYGGNGIGDVGGVGFVRAGDWYFNSPYFYKGKSQDRWKVATDEDFLAEYEPVP